MRSRAVCRENRGPFFLRATGGTFYIDPPQQQDRMIPGGELSSAETRASSRRRSSFSSRSSSTNVSRAPPSAGPPGRRVRQAPAGRLVLIPRPRPHLASPTMFPAAVRGQAEQVRHNLGPLAAPLLPDDVCGASSSSIVDRACLGLWGRTSNERRGAQE